MTQEPVKPPVDADAIPVKVTRFLDRNLIYNWRENFLKLWTIRIALFWAGFAGLVGVYPYFGGIVPNTPLAIALFAASNVIMCMVLVVGRMVDQPGVKD